MTKATGFALALLVSGAVPAFAESDLENVGRPCRGEPDAHLSIGLASDARGADELYPIHAKARARLVELVRDHAADLNHDRGLEIELPHEDAADVEWARALDAYQSDCYYYLAEMTVEP